MPHFCAPMTIKPGSAPFRRFALFANHRIAAHCFTFSAVLASSLVAAVNLPGMNKPWGNTKYIVSDAPAFAYFVVPKVACSSVKTALLPVFGMEPPTDGAYGVHALFDNSPHQIDKAALTDGLKGRYAGHFKFVFVRNPWDRLVSCYSQKLAPDGQGLGRENYAGQRFYVGMPFGEFAEAVCRVPDRRSNPHWRSQHVVACGDGGRKRVLADFVGRYERLEEDFAFVARRLGLDGGLPRLLPSGRGDYRDFYDRKLAERVAERYRLDLDIFGYSF